MYLKKNTLQADLRKSTILMVEDDEEDILLLKRALRNARIANPLNVVKDGEEAIKYLSGDGAHSDRTRYPIPFLILLDLRLPNLSGFEVLAWIRDVLVRRKLCNRLLQSGSRRREALEGLRLSWD